MAQCCNLSITKKKISAICFILLGLSPLLFAFFISVQKEEIYRKMKKRFEVERLQTIVLPENDVVWMDKHEIWVNNSMFDIASKKLENGVYTFTGLYDNEETELANKEKETSEKNNESEKLLSHILRSLPVFFTVESDSQKMKKDRIVYFSFTSDYSKNPYHKVLVPPPQFYC